MKLAIMLGAVLAVPLVDGQGPGISQAEPPHLVTMPRIEATPFARLRNVVGTQVVNRFVDDVVRMRVAMRDLGHAATDGLAWLAAHSQTSIPDVRCLTTNPVAQSESSGFGWRNDPITRERRWHSGADLRGKYGTPVLAAGDGVVMFTGVQSGYGNIVYVDHGGGVITRYAHLQRITAKKGATITAGTKLGEVGSTGRATGPHLHFEVRLDGRPVDPLTAMTVGQLERESPSAGQIAAYALSSEIQGNADSRVDPPKTKPVKQQPAEQRPERRGRVVRPKPVS